MAGGASRPLDCWTSHASQAGHQDPSCRGASAARPRTCLEGEDQADAGGGCSAAAVHKGVQARQACWDLGPLAWRAGALCPEGMNGSGDEQRRRGPWLYAPLGTAFFLALAVVGLLVIGLVALDALSYVYHRIGISLAWMAIITAAALLGSMINIPVARLRAEVLQADDQPQDHRHDSHAHHRLPAG